MRHRPIGLLLALVLTPPALLSAVEGLMERLEQALTVSSPEGSVRGRLSGSAELEAFVLSEPVSDLVFARRSFLNPRLSLFLDAQAGEAVYGFAQVRADRRFDPSSTGDFRLRLDELAVRLTPWADGRLSFQIGQFATVAGHWPRRHLAWENPFVTAPVPYDNLLGLWDGAPAVSAEELLAWAHVEPASLPSQVASDKSARVPIVWGPSYASGVAVAARHGKMDVALEMKNASLSSRPKIWNDHGAQWDYPTFTARVGYVPSEPWRFGLSASRGPYLVATAESFLPVGHSLRDYQQLVVAHDLSYAWRHLQIWAEFFAARFQNPNTGDLDTLAYFVEAKYKFGPQFSLAVRWNQQHFEDIRTKSGDAHPWGRQLWRVDIAPAYRLSPQMQLKLQYSLRHEDPAPRALTQSVAAQFMVRF